MPTVDDYYRNRYQYGLEDYTTAGQGGDTQAVSYATGYIPELLALRQRVLSGQATDWDREWYAQQEQAARAIPLRDVSTLSYNAGDDAPDRVSGGSPDLGHLMLTLQERIEQGTATAQERDLFQTTYTNLVDQNWRASVPQASDANPFGMGDQFMMALAALTAAAGGAGSFGAFGAAGAAGGAGAGAAGGAAAGASAAPSLLGVPLSTLSTIGQIGTYGGMGANVLGAATDQDWLTQLGLGLGVTGGLAGGLAGLGSVLNTGVTNLTDAARLASSAGRLAGAGGRASGYGPLQQAAGWLGRAGQVGSFGAGVLPSSVTDWSGTNAPLAANVNPEIQASAADWSTQRGGEMSEWDYSWDYGGEQPYDNWSYAGGSPTFDESGGGNFFNSPAYQQFTGWGGDERQTGWYQNADLDTSAGGGWLTTVLGGLGAAGGFLGRNASWLGPAASALGGIGAGAVGANASRDASAAQTQALNRGIDLQTAQWLQQQANQAPWLAAGMSALPQLQQLAGQGAPAPFSPTAVINPADYTPGLPGATPGWTPQTMDAGAYRWTPGQGPRAADYRYTPGQTPDAAQYASGPPQLYQGAMPGTAIPTLTGQQVLDQDPGVRFRLDEARKALEASALARGSGMSGSTLAALGRQSQDLSSQEYQNAWQRMMGANTEQYGRNWNQYQQHWNQGVQGTQLGLQTNAQNFGQALSAAQLREQVGQVASQQGWSQAQAEAAFREQMEQQASQQGFSQALQGQTWNQGQAQQYDTERYNRMMGLNQLQYGRDQTYNTTLNDRALQAYNSQQQQQATDWNRWASLAGVGQTAANQLGAGGQGATSAITSLLSQLGTAQGQGAMNQGNAWSNALGNASSAVQGGLGNLQFQNQLSSLLAGLNR